MNIVIVEDDTDASDKLKNYLNKYGKDENIVFDISCYTDGETFLKNYRKENAGIVFLDIELPNIDGMSVARQIREVDASAVIIFVTKMVQFAAKGYEVDALDFLVKPVVYPEFALKMRRAVNIARMNEEEGILVPVNNGFYRVATDDILFVEIMGHSLKYQLADRVVEARGTLKEVQKILEGHGFVRCNSCYLVNSRYIDAVEGYQVSIKGFTLKISQPRRKTFMKELMNIYLGSGKGD